jgi:hypothetical protein
VEQGVMEAGGCRTEILDDADAIGLWEGEAIALVRALCLPDGGMRVARVGRWPRCVFPHTDYRLRLMVEW